MTFLSFHNCNWQHNCKNLSFNISVLACFSLPFSWERSSVPEEDVPGLVAGVWVNQLLFQILQWTVVDVNWTLQLAAVTSALLGKLSAEADMEVWLLWFREVDSFFFSCIWKHQKKVNLCKMFEQLKSCRRVVLGSPEPGIQLSISEPLLSQLFCSRVWESAAPVWPSDGDESTGDLAVLELSRRFERRLSPDSDPSKPPVDPDKESAWDLLLGVKVSSSCVLTLLRGSFSPEAINIRTSAT